MVWVAVESQVAGKEKLLARIELQGRIISKNIKRHTMDGNSTVIKLEGIKNWNIWKFQTMVLLRGQSLIDIVEGRLKKGENLEERRTWETNDAKAQTMLVTRMTEEVMLHIISCTTSSQMWRKLASIFEQKSETSIHIIQQRFFQYKYEEGMEMSIFLSKIQELQNQLKQMGEEISEKFVITKVLMSLPYVYKHFVSAWESAPDDKQTYDNLVARLLVEEERVKEKGEIAPSSSAFIAKKNAPIKKNIKCFKCNKMGHYQAECTKNENSNKRNNSINKSEKKCYYCNKIGHNKSECWFKKGKDKNAFVVQQNPTEPYQQSKWLVDTGASEHMCQDKNLFSTFSPLSSQKSVIIGDGTQISVIGCGQVALEVHNGHKWIESTIDNVLCVPDLKINLFSVNCAADRGYVMMTDEKVCKFYKKNKVRAVANRVGNMYIMDVRYKYGFANITEVKSSFSEWHEKLVHQNIQHVKNVLAKNNVKVFDEPLVKCQGCLSGKAHRLPFHNSETKAMKTCELIHADLCGPMEEMSVGGSRYFLILKDDYSCYRNVYFIKKKDEVINCIKDFINKAENVTGNNIITFRSDNGLEFINGAVSNLFSGRGIVHQTSVPYTPQQNGKAEREIRTLTEAARSMLYARNLPKKLWAEAVNTAAYVLNRTSGSHDPGKTPYEIWTNKQFDLSNLHIFGTPVSVHIPKEKRRKWDSKGETGIMVGYGENVKGYRIFYPKTNQVQVKRDVIFLEPMIEKQERVNTDFVTESVNNETSVSEQNSEEEVMMDSTLTNETADEDQQSLYEPEETSDVYSEYESDNASQLTPSRRITRIRKPTQFYTCQNVYTAETEPGTYKEAMQRSDAFQWKEAINQELETLKANNTWTVCPVPENQKVISSKWVFKIKKLDNIVQYKARLVARGFEQNDSLDLYEIYSPVAKLSTFRLFISVATKLNLAIHQMDVTGAFLYGDIKENVFIKLPEGAYNGCENIVKLNKSLYGLKKSPKYWNEKFNSVISKVGYVKSKNDPCLFTKCSQENQTYVLLYVDDILMFSSNEEQISDLKSHLQKVFKMKDLGLVSNFLGINVKQNLKDSVTELSQKSYLENVLKRFNMENCKPISTPIDQNFNVKILEVKECKSENNIENTCRKIIGSLMYAVLGTRPDLCIAVSILSRYQNNASEILLTHLKRVLRYVKHTLDYKLVYKCNDDGLVGHCDADWGGDLTDRKSTTGYCFKFSGCLISWCSKKQCSVSLSSTEAEYVAVSMAASESCWLASLLKDFNIINVYPIPMYCDNQSAIMVANTDNIKRLKHIDIRYHFIKDLINDGKMCLIYVKTQDQIADMFTKSLNKELLFRFVTRCGLK